VVISLVENGVKLPSHPEGKPSDIEGESESQTRTRWISAAIIHYAGNGLWSIGVIPVDPQSKWDWLEDIPTSSVRELLAEAKFRRCPTENLVERLRES